MKTDTENAQDAGDKAVKPRVTMRAVAAAAGVHQTTVSLALRGDRRITVGTRQRIAEVARAMGYRPNPLVSALSATRNRRNATRQATLGYVTADSMAYGGPATLRYFQDFYDGALVRADQLGYGLDHFWLGDPDLDRARFSQITQARGIHGLIIAPSILQKATLDIEWDRFSVLAYGNSMETPGVHRISPDFLHATFEMHERCRRAGHPRVGLALEHTTDRKVEHAMLAATLADQRLHPIANPVPPLLAEPFRHDVFLEWFQRHRPDVVVGMSGCARSMEGWLKDEGLVIGRNVQLIRFGAAPDTDAPHIAGVWMDRQDMGARAVDFVVDMIHRNETGIPDRTRTLVIETRWHDAPSFVPRDGSELAATRDAPFAITRGG